MCSRQCVGRSFLTLLLGIGSHMAISTRSRYGPFHLPGRGMPFGGHWHAEGCPRGMALLEWDIRQMQDRFERFVYKSIEIGLLISSINEAQKLGGQQDNLNLILWKFSYPHVLNRPAGFVIVRRSLAIVRSMVHIPWIYFL